MTDVDSRPFSHAGSLKRTQKSSFIACEEERPAKKHQKERIPAYLDLKATPIDLTQKPHLDRLTKALHKKRKIVVIAGAGISVSAGIPDFRSSTGLFRSLRDKHNLKSSGKALFDASVYRDAKSTASFHAMVREMSEMTKAARPTPFHHLLATLADEGRLLRLYSQNVDGLDTNLPPLSTKTPLPTSKPWPKTIQVHGGLDKMVCSKCHTISPFESELFKNALPPSCSDCEATDSVRTEHAGKRSHGIGKLRPRLVLYNEHNPDAEAIGSVTQADLRTRPDALIVVGTTLKVPGVRRIAREMCKVVRDRRDGITIWINNDPEPPTGKDLEDCWDLIVQGPCDEVARHAAMRKWTDNKDDFDHFNLVTDDQLMTAKKERGLKEIAIVSPSKSRLQTDATSFLTPPESPTIRSLDLQKENAIHMLGKEQKPQSLATRGKPSNIASKGKPGPKPGSKRGRKPAADKTTALLKINSVFSASKPAAVATKAIKAKSEKIEVQADPPKETIPLTPTIQIPGQDSGFDSSPLSSLGSSPLSSPSSLTSGYSDEIFNSRSLSPNVSDLFPATALIP